MSGRPTILKDGSRFHVDVIGKIVRFRKGRTALMRIISIEEDPWGKLTLENIN